MRVYHLTAFAVKNLVPAAIKVLAGVQSHPKAWLGKDSLATLLAGFSSSHAVGMRTSVSCDCWPEAALCPLLCDLLHRTAHKAAVCFSKASKGEILLTGWKLRCYVISSGSDTRHLCCILLARGESQASPALRGGSRARVWTPESGDYWGPFKTTICFLVFSLGFYSLLPLFLFWIGSFF